MTNPRATQSATTTLLTVLLIIAGTAATGIGIAGGLLGRLVDIDAMVYLPIGGLYLLAGISALMVALWLSLSPAIAPPTQWAGAAPTMPVAEEAQ